MKVQIKNATNLRELRLKKDWEVELEEGSTIGDLLSKLELDRLKEEDGTISSYVMVFRNKKAVRKTDVRLENGDKLKIMPLASGG